jgi:hypothetical protein
MPMIRTRRRVTVGEIGLALLLAALLLAAIGFNLWVRQ